MGLKGSIRPFVPATLAVLGALAFFGLLSAILPQQLKFILWPISIVISAVASFVAAELAPENLRERIHRRFSALKKEHFDEPELTLKLDLNYSVENVDIDEIHGAFESGLGTESTTQELFVDDYKTSYGRIHRKIRFDTESVVVPSGTLQQEMETVTNVRSSLEIETRYKVLRDALELVHSEQRDITGIVSAHGIESSDYTLVCEMESPVLLKGMLSKLDVDRAEFRLESGSVVRFKDDTIRVKHHDVQAEELPRVYNFIEDLVVYYG